MSKFEEMDTFVKVVEAGTMTLAAERLNIAKSAVSRRLSELEERLQAQLFIRTTRKLTLTDTGRGFYQRCLRILADVDESEAQVSLSHSELRGRLRVALPSSFAQRHMTQILMGFMCEHRGLVLDFDFNDRRVDIVQEGFDVAIRIGSLSDSTLIARRLVRIRMMLCASPDYLRRCGVPKTPQDLLQHKVMGYSLSADPGLRYLADDGSTEKVILPEALSANSGEFLLQAGVHGLGLLWEPTFLLHEEVEAGRLVPLLTDCRWVGSQAHLLYPQTRHLSARVRGFVDHVVQQFAGMPPWDRKLAEMGHIGPGC